MRLLTAIVTCIYPLAILFWILRFLGIGHYRSAGGTAVGISGTQDFDCEVFQNLSRKSTITLCLHSRLIRLKSELSSNTIMHQSIPTAPCPPPRATAEHLPVLSVPGVGH